MKYSIFILLFSLISTTTTATKNLYIEIGKEEITVGEYSGDSYTPGIIKTFPRSDYSPKEIRALLLDEQREEKVLFYIHSMWGGNAWYHQSSLKQLNSLQPVDRIISIVWHTDHLGYKASWEKAIFQGELLAPLIEELMTNGNNQNYLLCHSMGHRLLEGMAKELKAAPVHFVGVFLMAADLHVDVFEGHLNAFPQQTDNLFIYVNQKDKWLRPSKWIHGKERLGLNAGTKCADFAHISQIQIVDVSNIATPGWRTQRSHIYFKNNALVLADIEQAIGGQTISLENTENPDCQNIRVLR